MTSIDRQINALLIANRGEIAERVIRTARRLGIRTVAVFNEPDRDSRFVRQADVAVRLPGSGYARAYLDIDAILDVAARHEVDGIHPGYGFLSERADFAAGCAAAGLIFIGPPAEIIRRMGSKIESKEIAAAAGVPLLPSATLLGDTANWVAEGARVGYPLLVKASAGGGGRGMRVVTAPGELTTAVGAAQREALASFGDSAVFLEKLITRGRHVEVQVFGDSHGNVVHLGERDCSVQRRHQKLIEETPSPGVSSELRAEILAAGVALARHVGYVNAGTVEMLVDADGFYFLEMNTRLQVEHPVTEAVTGLDLVEWQLRVAEGEPLPLCQDDIVFSGHSIEARLVAEDPANGFAPSSGLIRRYQPDPLAVVRSDDWVESGTVVSSYFDSLLAKVVAHGRTRTEALRTLAAALSRLQIHGISTNRDQLVATLTHPEFRSGGATTAFLDDHPEVMHGAADANVMLRRLVAATAAAERASRAAATVQRSVPSGWRNVAGSPQRISWRCGGEEFAVAYRVAPAGRLSVEVADAEPSDWQVRWDSDTTCVVSSADALIVMTVHRFGDTYFVNDSSGQSDLELIQPLQRHRTGANADASVAPLPGTVVDVLIAPGDTVEEGQTLVILEAMKMEHRVVAAAAGVIERIEVAVGGTVEANQVVVRLKTESDVTQGVSG